MLFFILFPVICNFDDSSELHIRLIYVRSFKGVCCLCVLLVFFSVLFVGWLAWRQAAVCVCNYYTILRTRGALPVSKKKKRWGGGGWGRGLRSREDGENN